MTNRLFLSRIRKQYRIVTGTGSQQVPVKWVDFDLNAFEREYPEVENFLFRPANLSIPIPGVENFFDRRSTIYALPWDSIESIDWTTGLVRVAQLEVIHPLSNEEISKKVLVVRDIEDAYIIDLLNKRLTRANDLLLEHNQDLRLVAAGTGMQALLRRITAGLYKGYRENDLIDWRYVEFLRGEPGAVQQGAGYHRRIQVLPAGDIASLAEGLPYLHATELIMLLPFQQASDTMELLTPERQLQVFEELDPPTATHIIEGMAPDIAADIIGRLTIQQAHEYLDQLPKLTSERIIDLLRYPENSVGGIMTNDVIALPGRLTVAGARKRLRDRIQDPDFIYFIYVVDSDEGMHLQGVITLRTILTASDSQRLEEIMNPYLETLGPLDPPQKAAYRLIKSQLAALPVTSNDGRLLGVVTVDTAVNLVAPSGWSMQAPRIFS